MAESAWPRPAWWRASWKPPTPHLDDLALTTVNAGPAAFRAAWLRRALPRVQPSPTSGERYLTQLVDLAIEDGELVAGYQITDLDETIGCDDLERLAAADAAFRRRA